MELKRITPADNDRLRPLAEAYWMEIMPHADTIRSKESRDAYFARRFPLYTDGNQVFWGLEDGQAIGFVSLSIENSAAKINDFYVAPEQRRRGCGSRLLQAVLDKTDDLGIEKIDLNVRRDNPHALAFWQAQGFVIGHHELTQYRHPQKRIGFRGALSSDFAGGDNSL